MNDKENKDVVEQIFKLINYMGNDEALANRFVEHLRTEHRTLQASFIRTLKMVIDQGCRVITCQHQDRTASGSYRNTIGTVLAGRGSQVTT